MLISERVLERTVRTHSKFHDILALFVYFLLFLIMFRSKQSFWLRVKTGQGEFATFFSILLQQEPNYLDENELGSML